MTKLFDTTVTNFDIAEENLKKLESLWGEIQDLIPEGLQFFGESPEGLSYEEKCRAFARILKHMPRIDGYSIKYALIDLDAICQMRLKAIDLNEPGPINKVEESIFRQGRLLREYRAKLEEKRKEIVRGKCREMMGIIDVELEALGKAAKRIGPIQPMPKRKWAVLSSQLESLADLLGDGKLEKKFWGNLWRHLHFGQKCDYRDIVETDWPEAKQGIHKFLYGKNEPLPLSIKDLGEHSLHQHVVPEALLTATSALGDDFIRDRVEKCDRRIANDDHAGAITIARSMVEGLLLEVLHKRVKEKSSYDGDLPRLYKQVRGVLSLTPGEKVADDAVNQVLSGLINVVSGLATLRNRMSDSHPQTVAPSKYHARLAVNAAKTLADFIWSVHQASVK